jgi:hypothetical protein
MTSADHLRKMTEDAERVLKSLLSTPPSMTPPRAPFKK